MGIELPDTMEATLIKHDHPAIKKLLEYRSFEKTLSAFGEKFLELINTKTGRIHPDFNQLGRGHRALQLHAPQRAADPRDQRLPQLLRGTGRI